MIWSSPLPSLDFQPQRSSNGWLGPWAGHLPFARDLVAAVRPKLFVELGTYYGESYFGFCQALQEESLRCDCFSIDTWRGDDHGGHYGDEVYQDVDAYNRVHYASFSNLRRMTFAEARPAFAEESIDILHIDGRHSYEDVTADFESWFPTVRPGGIVLLHDVCATLPEFGVWRFWESLSGRYQTFTFPHSYGLGVLRKPGSEAPADFLASLFDAGEKRAEIERYYAGCFERLQLRFNASESAKAARESAKVPPGSDLCAVQVFYTFGENDDRPENGALQVVKAGNWERLTFPLPLPYGRRTKALRVDPADRPAVIEISDISVRAQNDTAVLWRWDPERTAKSISLGGTAILLSVDSSQITVLSTGFDPQLFLLELRGPAYHKPLQLELRMRFTPPAAWIERVLCQADPIPGTPEPGIFAARKKLLDWLGLGNR